MENRHISIKGLLMGVCILVVSFGLTGCGFIHDLEVQPADSISKTRYSHLESSDQFEYECLQTKIYTNTDDGRNLLSGLTDIEEITYRAEPLGEQNGRTPGPSDYQYWGVVYISADEEADIYSKYEFEECEVEIDPSLRALYKDIDTREWQYSKELSKALIKPGYSGKVYLSGNMIYFMIFSS